MIISDEDRDIIVGALDTIGLALVDHDHTWTEGERTIYEQACRILGIPCEFRLATPEELEDDDDDDGEAWKKS